MNPANVLILPGWQNSGPDHWQSRWQASYGYRRVEQHDWMRPLRGDWMARLEDVLLQVAQPAFLVAHSLGCHLAAAWAVHTHNAHLVRAALLVAPADVEREELRPVFPSWSPIPLQGLPFKSLVVASSNDPYCSDDRSREFASAWGSNYLGYGKRGHINAESGLDAWPEGHAWLHQIEQQVPAPMLCVAGT